ncbi:MAG: alpha/beta fold hydrolase [Oceanospirillaceae bacterium]|nr:alpha/beta fold hydrolase [Oceanospirillaceae bacterium]
MVILLIVAVLYLNSRADLNVWHKADLDEEFNAEKGLSDFQQYLSLEARLFQQLEEDVYQKVPAEQQANINRYTRGSLSDPERWPTNWNRTFELSAEQPTAGILLLHGMSDSPYSLRQLGTVLNGAGAYVIGLRLPGHGTAPSGLTDLEWQDLEAAVELAMRHLANQSKGQPLYIIGYSTGAALAVLYALSALEDNRLSRADGLILVSPAIGVSSLAVLAVWQARLGRWLGLDKLAWNSISPEYDPFKYGSFAINAGDVVYRITGEIQRRIDDAQKNGTLSDLPPLLAFASVVDATVSTPALVSGLFDRLPAAEHELVLFDINHNANIEPIMRADTDAVLRLLQTDEDRPYILSLVSNEPSRGDTVMVSRTAPADAIGSETPLDIGWPEDLYSLSHVALPFPPQDPLYGGPDAAESPGIRLGDFALLGERGVLQIPAAEMLRLRWNPFYRYLEKRVLDFLALSPTQEPHN